uniref:Cytochrome b-c1 complex subunit Rieske, mitochondrial n=1 Tax=Romanomermis culicivorax TaxID=13658 RepID=A0A915IME9_ROMCU
MIHGGPNSIRYSHTDVSFPDFESYRRDSSKDVTKRCIETEDQRKVGPYLAYGVAGILSLYSVKHIANTIIEYKSAPRSMLALAAIEVNLNDIPEGKSATFLWRGKPVFVRHRTKEQIERERAVKADTLRDPQTDEQRVKKAEWLVVIANAGSYGGYYCPCHGSHYDTSGRIRQGPAPLNLEVPEYYEFVGDDKLVVGKP